MVNGMTTTVHVICKLVSFGDKPSAAAGNRHRPVQELQNVHSWYNLRPEKSLKSKRKQIIKSLRIISRYSRDHGAISFGQSFDKSCSRVEDQVFCVLHLQKWIIEKVIMLLFTRSVDELASEEKTKRVKHIGLLQSYINTIALGSVTNPGHWKCPVKTNKRWATAILQMVRQRKLNSSCLPSSPRLWCWNTPRKTFCDNQTGVDTYNLAPAGGLHRCANKHHGIEN
jgi:hypothetical protein